MHLSDLKLSTIHGVVILTEGEYYLGGAVGTSSFVHQYVERKVECWVNEIEKLSKIAETQLHSAYAAYTLMGYPQNGITFYTWRGRKPT